MRSGAGATFMDKAIDTLPLYLSVVLDNDYSDRLDLDQSLSSNNMLEILRINLIGI